MDDPVVGGYAPEKVALRRAVSLAFDNGRYIREIYRSSALAAESPFVPGTFGFDTAFRTELSEHSPARAKALLDVYGYVDRDGDGWREAPDGSRLVLEMASSTSQLDRRQNEQWKRSMDAVGLRMEFRVAQWPELLKQSLAGKLMMWGFGWQAGQPDSDLFFSLAYGPNLGSANDARFELKAYDALYARQRRLPDGPERLAVMREASRLLVGYMPYKFIAHRIQLDLTQPWVLGFLRPPFTTRLWAYLDIDPAARSA
jgi:ABC-type transport system substrate-binding protein